MIKTFAFKNYVIVWSNNVKGNFINSMLGENEVPADAQFQAISIWEGDKVLGCWLPNRIKRKK